ncbi:hypothetical protein KP509_06G044100 [Ceratopteris richardii]|uniref:Protein kinase domain-containing protein n=1 Tax=Ceratopteris richardii TaxID=49495 RepID=A0A8T2UMH8_CERRI|nr:hypothetical protein KP509_06G044100 [Ceratopteris richardii]
MPNRRARECKAIALYLTLMMMAENVSLVLDFLRKHNFEKAEEALRSELQARHSFATHDYHFGNAVIDSFLTGRCNVQADWHENTSSLGETVAGQASQLKQESVATGYGISAKTHHNHSEAYTDWEFKSCNDQDCVLEFRKTGSCQRALSSDVSVNASSSNRQNSIGPLERCNPDSDRGEMKHGVKDRNFFNNDCATNDHVLCQNSLPAFGSTCDYPCTMTLNHNSHIQQDAGPFEVQDCCFEHESTEDFQRAAYALKLLPLYNEDDKVASSACHPFSGTSWLDHGVGDDDAFGPSIFSYPTLHRLPPSKVLEQQEDKQVVKECTSKFNALALDDGDYSSDLFKNISLPWETGKQILFTEDKLPIKRKTGDCCEVPSLMLTPKNVNLRRAAEKDILDKVHTNVLFEPSFNLGSFLDIPVGQEIASSGGQQQDGFCVNSCRENAMENTPELLSGFATLGDEPTDPVMGYCKEYWDSDTYEDDDDPGYERQEIEDEEWFLEKEMMLASGDPKIKMMEVKLGENNSEVNGICENMHEKEGLIASSQVVSDSGGCNPNQIGIELDISGINTLLEDISADGGLTLKEIGNMSYDGHLMDAEELKLMRAGTAWQGLSSEVKNSKHCTEDMGKNYAGSTNEDCSGKKHLTLAQMQMINDLSHEYVRSKNALSFSEYYNSQTVHGYLDSNELNDATPCPAISTGFTASSQENITCMQQPHCDSMLQNQESQELSPLSVSEIATSPNNEIFGHSKSSSSILIDKKVPYPRNEGTRICTNGSSVSEPEMEEVETSPRPEELQVGPTDEDDYEIFNLRIIHRRNRTGFEEEKHFQVELESVVAGRYLITEYLGSAAFSKAIQARDLLTGMDVCMKIIKNNKDFFDQSLDEIKLLKYINKNDPADKYHLLRLYDYFYHREHLFIVCELLRANLYEFHKFNRESGVEIYFTMPRLQSIARQCLEALEFLHGIGLIHCDLKPENILIKSYSRCEIKVIDFGSSCFQTDHLCSYVQSRSYRAPEVILGLPYDEKIDIWSLGCILAELCSGNVLFQNDSLATLLARVIGIIEPMTPDMILNGKEAHKYFTRNLMLYERNQETHKLEYLLPKKTSLRHRLPAGDQGFVDFVGYLLQVNPENRPSASEALKHPWLTQPYEVVCEQR